MIGLQRVTLEGRRYVLLPEAEYERICQQAGEAVEDADLPELPKPNKSGRFPALEYARASLARDIVRDRKALGLSQERMAELSGLRQETISRIETGKHTASVKTIEKIEKAIERERKRKDGSQKGRS